MRMSTVRKEMAESADLKHMVMTFRVSELQVLLGFAGRNKTGRKQELLTRALNLVQKGCSMPVQIKIRELYRKINEQLFLSARRRFPGGGAPTGPSDITGPPQSPQAKESPPASPVKKKDNAPIPTQDTVGQKTAELNKVSALSGIGLEYGKHVPMMAASRPPNSVPVHPDVRLKVLPFYDLQGELLKPSSLVPRGAVRFQENYFVFHLTPQQAQDIAMSRDYRPCAKCDYLVQVQLRFCLLETSCEQDDNFPPSICVRVNGKMAALPNPIPSSKPGVEPRRPSRPVDITPLCRLSPTSSNHVDVSWASEFGRGYCVAIYLVKKLSSDILFTRLKQKGTKHPDHSRALIKEKLSHDPDSEIATTSLRVSLCCPLGKMRMQNPSRASTCSHLQCFDASTFLMMNEKKPTWTCPVCDKPAPFDKLILDGLFVEILQQAFDCNEIQFSEDCSWKPLRHNKEAQIIASPIIDNSSPQSSKKKPLPEIIDLTSDTSDDEDDDDDDDPIEASPPPKLTQAGCVSPPITPKLESMPPILTHYTTSPFNLTSQALTQPTSMYFAQPLTPSPKLSTTTTTTSPYSLPKGVKIKCQLDSPPPAHSSPVKTQSFSPVSFKPSYRVSPYPTVSSPNLYSHLGIPGLTPVSQQYYQDMYKMFQLNQAAAASQYYNPQPYISSPLNLSKRPVMDRDSDDHMTS